MLEANKIVMNNMKVAFLHWLSISLNLNDVGGITRVALSEIENHSNLGVDSQMFGVDIIGNHPKVRKLRKYSSLRTKSGIASTLEFIFRNRNRSILHGMNTTALGILAPKKTLVHFHNNPNIFHHPTRSWARDRYTKTHFAFVSEYIKNEFIKLCPYVPDNQLFTLHNGVDPCVFMPDKDKKIDGKIKLYYCGNWCEEKGVHFLLDAIKILEKKRNDFELYLAGSVGFWSIDVKKAKAYEKLISEKIKALKSVKVLGALKYEAVAETLKCMDIFVNPALWGEPFPLVNLEAASTGLPIVSNEVGGIPELVKDGYNGYLVKDIKPEIFAQTIERFLENKELIEVFGKRSRELILREFSWDRHAEKLLRIYEKILNQ